MAAQPLSNTFSEPCGSDAALAEYVREWGVFEPVLAATLRAP